MSKLTPKRGRPGWWPETLRSMKCNETIPAKNKSEAMTAYVAARRIGLKISVKKQPNGSYLCKKECK